MKILQVCKYYSPSKGGIEYVVKSIVSVLKSGSKYSFGIYTCNHKRSWLSVSECKDGIPILRIGTFIIYRRQPLTIFHGLLFKSISRYDIIHFHLPWVDVEILIGLFLQFITKQKLVVTLHADVLSSRSGFFYYIYKIMQKRILLNADHIILTSEFVFNTLNINGIDRSKISIIPIGVSLKDIGTFYPKKLSPHPSVLFVGKIREYKGLNYLIDAFKFLPYKLHIIGSGENEGLIIDRIKKFNLTEKVFYHGELSDEELKIYYSSCDLFVLPSIDEREAFGIVQLEAMARGIPVINTSILSGVPYVSLNNVSGLTIPPRSVDALVDSIKTVLSSPSLYNKLSCGALNRVSEFDLNFTSNKYSQIYDNL